MTTLLLANILLGLTTCDSARILVFQTSAARSHNIVVDPLLEELATRGHHLTVVTRYPRHAISNITYIDVSYNIRSSLNNLTFNVIKEKLPNPVHNLIFLLKRELNTCEQFLSEKIIQNLFNSNTTVDLVMTEVFGCDCFVQFANKFNAPLISYATSTSLPWNTDRVGLPDNPSYIPNFFLGYSPSMNFFQRTFNLLVVSLAKLVYNYYSIPHANSLTEKYLSANSSTTEQIIKNTSLIFINSHFSLTQSRPFPPNVVGIGGIHIRESTTSIPKDLQDILDSSPQGVILMSFGTVVKASSIPRHILLMFMNVFSTLSQTVIFKYEDDLPEAPPNVVVRKWLPQRQIIEHPNVKILLAHGGLASTIEAVYFGKPLIGVPFYGDQFLNVQAVVHKGAGLMLNLNDLSEQKIQNAIIEILTKPMYTKNMKELSLQFRDRPMTALQSAVYWTEYVIRHQGAPHLRPASVDLALYQYLLLDVIGIIFLIVLIICYTIHVTIIRIRNKIINVNKKYVKTD